MHVEIEGKGLLDEHISLGYAEHEQVGIERLLKIGNGHLTRVYNTHCNIGILCILFSPL